MPQTKLVAAIDEVGLTGGSAKTVLQIVAGAHPLAIQRWGVYFDGVSGTAEPVQVEVARQTGAGTSGAGTVSKLRPSDGVTQAATARINFTAEPTKNEVLDIVECHPQSGYEAILAQDDWIIVPASGRVGIICTLPAGSVNVRAKFHLGEFQNMPFVADYPAVRDAAGIDPTVSNNVTEWLYDITGANSPGTLGYNRNVEDTTKRQVITETINGDAYQTTLKFNQGSEPLRFEGPIKL